MKLTCIRGLLLLLPLLLCLCACERQSTVEAGEAKLSASVQTYTSATVEKAPDSPSEEDTEKRSVPQKEEVSSDFLAMAEDGLHPRLIAHAGGSIYGYRLTNSLEALNQSYREGFRFIEVDLNRTSDGELVLIHDWESVSRRMLGRKGVCSLAEFRNADTMAGLTLLSLDDLLDWLAKHPDCTIITDIKHEDNCATLGQLAMQAGEQMSQFIPQAYNYEEFTTIREMGFEQVILTLYQLYGKALKTDELISFANTEQPWSVTIPDTRLKEDLVSALADEGIPVYAHAVNSVDTFDEWVQYGLTGIYTDYFQPAHWIYRASF